MKPETADYLAKARESLDEAQKTFQIGLMKVAARATYFVAFHAAQALIFERAGKVAKTHSGVHAEFARLTLVKPGLDPAFVKFLSHAYSFKEISDYSIDPRKTVTPGECSEAIANVQKLVSAIAAILDATPPDNPPR